LFTDGRYFNQASKQLDKNWQLMKVGLIKVPQWEEWVADISQDGKTVGVDPAVITVGIQSLGSNLIRQCTTIEEENKRCRERKISCRGRESCG
jgi:Xaa-Pro aminopeptidase